MAEPSQNNINLYKHYLEIAPKKARQAAVLLERFPSLGEKEEQKKEEERIIEGGNEEEDGKKSKR